MLKGVTVSPKKSDTAGIVASLACLVHCLCAPLIFLFMPAVNEIWSHPAVHWLFALLVLPLAAQVLLRGYQRHRVKTVAVFAGLGFVLIFGGLLVPHSQGSARSSEVTAFSKPPQAGTWTTVTPAESSRTDEEACAKDCCPRVVVDDKTGAWTWSLPLGGLLTMLGSVLLVIGHVTNMVSLHFSGQCCDAHGCFSTQE